MVVMMDYECNVCGNDPEYVEWCAHCGQTGTIRLPVGTPKPEPAPHLRIGPSEQLGFQVKVVDGKVTIDGVPCDCDAADVVKVLEALDVYFDIEEFSEYEGVDCTDHCILERFDDE